MSEKGNWGDKVMYFLFGGIIGATVALLFAPKTGEETRELLTTKAKEGREVLKKKVDTAQEKVLQTKEKLETEASELLNKGKEVVTKEKEVISAAIEAGKQAYKEEKKAAGKKKS